MPRQFLRLLVVVFLTAVLPGVLLLDGPPDAREWMGGPDPANRPAGGKVLGKVMAPSGRQATGCGLNRRPGGRHRCP